MLEAFEPVLIRTPRETSQAKNRKNLPTTYGGMRQTCMHAEMATLTSASANGGCWNRLQQDQCSSPPRRRDTPLSCVIRTKAHMQYKHNCLPLLFYGTLLYNTMLQVGFHPTTISLLWRGRKPTCNIALYSATLPYVIRIVTTGQRLKMSSCDRGLSAYHNSMQVFPPPTPIPR